MDIQVQLEDVSSVRKRLRVEVPAEVALKELNDIADTYRRRVRLPGFRPGKAPLGLVKRHFGKDIRSDLLQKLIPDSYEQVIRERSFRPVAPPSLENLSFEEGHPLVFEANFEVQPEVVPPEYRGIEVSLEAAPVTDAQVEAELEHLRRRQARLVSAGEEAIIEPGMVAVIDLDGEYLDGEEGPADPLHQEGVEVRVGDEHTHEAFTRTLAGARLGEERILEIPYAEDYPQPRLAGRRVRFKAVVREVKREELPALDDDLAKDVGDYENLEELTLDIRKRLTEQRERSREEDLGNQLVEKLLERSRFEVPESLVEDRVDAMLRDVAHSMVARGLDPSRANLDWGKVRSEFRPRAERHVRADLLLSEIGRRENIDVSGEELDEEISRLAESFDQPREKVTHYFQKESRRDNLRAQMVRGRVLKLLREAARVR
jgi:trigger factor